MSPDPRGELRARRVQHDFAWKVRLTHPDRAHVRVDWAGAPFVFDPVEVGPGERVVLTGAAPDRIRGVAAAVATGQRPDVIADAAIVAWLRTHGELGPATLGVSGTGLTTSRTADGVGVRSLAYTGPARARPLNSFLLASIGAFRPSRVRDSARALREAAVQEPVAGVAPRIWELDLPDAGRILHLDLALHRGTPAAWLEQATQSPPLGFRDADWVLAGCAYGEAEGVAAQVERFGARELLVTELVNGERRARGLPVEGVTPLRDRLHVAGLKAHVFATQASYRFE